MTRPGWDEWALAIAKAVSLRADCSRARHGAVILDQHHRMVSSGYNGYPSGHPGCLAGACPRASSTVPHLSSYDDGPGRCDAVHAEANALLYGDHSRYRGGCIYITGRPCAGCERLIRGAGLARAVWPEGELSL